MFLMVNKTLKTPERLLVYIKRLYICSVHL